MSAWWLLASIEFSRDDFPRPDFATSPRPYVTLMLIGFAVGILGHLFRSKTMVAIGVLAVFLGTVVLPLVVFISRS